MDFNFSRTTLFENTDFTSGIFNYGLGGSLSYFFEKLYIGIDGRYAWATDTDFSAPGIFLTNSSQNNFRALAKIEIKF